MSWEAEQYARRIRCGDSVTKFLFVTLSNWIGPDGDAKEVSIKRVANEIEKSARTVQRHLRRLEEMDLVRSVEVRRSDGGQGWSKYYFPHYKMPPVSDIDPPDKMSPPPVTPVTGSAPECHGGSDNGVMPDQLLNQSTPTDPNGSVAPKGAGRTSKRSKGIQIPDHWVPPLIETLTKAAAGLAEQWPDGAYLTEAEAFKNHHLALTGAKSYRKDWDRAWCARVVEITPAVMRAAKSGVRHAAPESRQGDTEPVRASTASRALEDHRSNDLRAVLRRRLGSSTFDHWLEQSAFVFGDGSLTIVSKDEFTARWIRSHYDQLITGFAEEVTGGERIAVDFAMNAIVCEKAEG